jgi:hypothetical protein
MVHIHKSKRKRREVADEGSVSVDVSVICANVSKC